MPDRCPECGADLSEVGDCQSIFDSFLVLEFTDPAYGEVHLLTVACFMIQHRRYSDEALVWIENTLRDALERGIPAQQIRERAAHESGQNRRAWSVMRKADARPLPACAWSMTIADVALRYEDAASYCALVKQWASITLREMKPWLAGR